MNKRKTLIFIFLSAFFIRFIFIVLFPLSAPDSIDYNKMALHIANGLGFSINLHRAPLYPSFLAIVYLIFGHNFLAVRIIQSILGAIICLFVYLIGERIFKNKKTAILGAGAAVICPSLVASNSYILTETLTTFLLTIAVILLMKALESKKRGDWVASGIFLGFSTLCRPVTLLFPLFLLLGLLFFHPPLAPPLEGGEEKGGGVLYPRKRFKKLIFVVIFSLTMAGTILPWTVRNYIVFKEFIPVGTGGGFNLWVGSYLPWNGDYNYKNLSDKENLVRGLSQIDADKKFFSEGVKNIKNNPGGYSLLCLKKFGRFWLQIPGGKRVLEGKNLQKAFIFTFHYILLFFFLSGLYLCLKEKRKELFIPLLMIFYFTFIHSLLFAIPRYRIPIMPLVYALAGGGLCRTIKNSKRRSRCEARSAVAISKKRGIATSLRLLAMTSVVKEMKLSVIMPVYNEEKTIAEIIHRVRAVNLKKEIIIVEDGSTDKTKEVLKEIIKQKDGNNEIKLISRPKKYGKGTAIRTGLKEVTGDIVIIQDADLEYNPDEYYMLVEPIIKEETKVVYGSRVLGQSSKPKSLAGWYFYLGGRSLSILANLLYRTHITDEPTCYKVFEANLLKSLNLKCKGFEFCPEVTAKVAKRGIRIKEVPISHRPRGVAEGKKIRLKDWFIAVWTLIKYRFIC